MKDAEVRTRARQYLATLPVGQEVSTAQLLDELAPVGAIVGRDNIEAVAKIRRNMLDALFRLAKEGHMDDCHRKGDPHPRKCYGRVSRPSLWSRPTGPVAPEVQCCPTCKRPL